MTERWKPVPGFEGQYEVSDLGRVRSLDRVVQCEGPVKGAYLSCKVGRLLRPATTRAGHLSVVLGRAAGSRLVHQLVAAAFIGAPPQGSEIRHLNGHANDNRVSNLAYGSRSQNIRDKKWHGHRPSGYVLNLVQVQTIKKELARGTTGVELSRRFNVAGSTISAIKTGKFHVDV